MTLKLTNDEAQYLLEAISIQYLSDNESEKVPSVRH